MADRGPHRRSGPGPGRGLSRLGGARGARGAACAAGCATAATAASRRCSSARQTDDRGDDRGLPPRPARWRRSTGVAERGRRATTARRVSPSGRRSDARWRRSQLRLLASRRLLPLFVAAVPRRAERQSVQERARHPDRLSRHAESRGATEILVTIAAAIFILPYFLFSATAGQLADKFEKQRLVRIVKLWEIGVMVLAAAGLRARQHRLPARRAVLPRRAGDVLRPGQIRHPARAAGARRAARAATR